ncbi:hypothetical protein D7V91_06625 [bacterium 1xD42-67]|nr:hypothetical protein D7V91_06625 [bacterium 1xD42-67]
MDTVAGCCDRAGCGYLGSYLANSQAEEKVVIQKVATPDAEDSITPAVEVAKAISPTVVSITTEKMTVNHFWFGPQISSGAGSGVIISEDGYILTCAHMVSGANSINVTTFDGAEFTASVVGCYEDGDIAVLKIEAEGLQAAVLGDSDNIQRLSGTSWIRIVRSHRRITSGGSGKRWWKPRSWPRPLLSSTSGRGYFFRNSTSCSRYFSRCCICRS